MKKISMILFLAISIILIKEQSANAQDITRSGRWGIGTTFDGIGLRYWFTEKFATDVNANFHYQKREWVYKSYGGGINAIYVLKNKNFLRFMGLAGVAYNVGDYNRENGIQKLTQQSDTISLSFGLGAEYSFKELPDLSFGAFLTGFKIYYSENTDLQYENDVKTSSGHQYDRGFSTSPSGSFSVCYHF